MMFDFSFDIKNYDYFYWFMISILIYFGISYFLIASIKILKYLTKNKIKSNKSRSILLEKHIQKENSTETTTSKKSIDKMLQAINGNLFDIVIYNAGKFVYKSNILLFNTQASQLLNVIFEFIKRLGISF
jgi:hypothetical protein